MVRALPWHWILLLRAFQASPAAQVPDFPKGLLVVEGDERAFRDRHMEPRHAVAIATVAKGSKRHGLLIDLAEDEDLHHLLAMGVIFKKGRTALSVHRYLYDPVHYEGKWTKSALTSWLQEVSFPPVNYLPQFPAAKFLARNPFGVLLVVKPVGAHSTELAKALEPHAARLSKSLKVSFFAKTPATQELCDIYGIRSSDEFLLLEAPKEMGSKNAKHSYKPGPPKYRRENVTAADVDQFFHDYESGHLPRYLLSSKQEEPAHEGLRELTGEDFLEVIQDPKISVLVEFVSANCEACREFEAAYQEVAKEVHRRGQRARTPSMSAVVIARMDQSRHEHTEFIRGTPWLRFWRRGKPRRGMDLELRSVDSILNFLDEQELALEEEL